MSSEYLSAALAGINNGIRNGLDIYTTIENQSRQKRAEDYQIKRDTLSDTRYAQDRAHTLNREGVSDEWKQKEWDYGVERDLVTDKAAAAKAQQDLAYKNAMLGAKYGALQIQERRLLNEEQKTYRADHDDRVGKLSKLVGDDGNVSAVLEQMNSDPDMAATVALEFGIKPSAEGLQRTMFIQSGDKVVLAQRGADGNIALDANGKPLPFDIDGDGKNDTYVINTSTLAGRLGSGALAQEKAADGQATSLAQGVAQQTVAQAAPQLSDQVVQNTESSRRAFVQGREAANPADPRDYAYGSMSQVMENNKNMPKVAAASGEALRQGQGEYATTLSGAQARIGGAKQIEQTVGGFSGKDKTTAVNTLSGMVKEGKEIQWYDHEFANVPNATERADKGREVLGKVTDSIAKDIESKTYFKVGDEQKSEFTGDQIKAKTRAALEANPEVLVAIHKDPSGKTSAIVRQAMAVAVGGGEPAAFKAVWAEFKRGRDGAEVIKLEKQLPAGEQFGADREQRFEVAGKLNDLKVKHPDYSFEQLLGVLKLPQK